MARRLGGSRNLPGSYGEEKERKSVPSQERMEIQLLELSPEATISTAPS
jgi:hypothetical protein